MDFQVIVSDAVRSGTGPIAAIYALAAMGLNLHFGYTGLLGGPASARPHSPSKTLVRNLAFRSGIGPRPRDRPVQCPQEPVHRGPVADRQP